MTFTQGGHPSEGARTASAGAFDPPNTDVNTVTLSEQCKATWVLAGRVLGDAEIGTGAITGTAKEFTDIISEDITSAASYNEKEWRKACMVVTYAAGVAEQWLQDVYDFRSDRRGLIDACDGEITRLRAEFPLLFNSDGFVSEGSLETMTLQNENYRVREATILDRYQRLGRELKEELLETAGRRATMLDEGPEPSNLKVLVEAGILGWGAHNILGVDADTPLPVSKKEAEVMARDLDPYLNGDKDPDRRFHEIMATLGAVNAKAAALQEANASLVGQHYEVTRHRTTLSKEEIEFLQAFHGELEERSPHGVVRLMPWLEGNDGPDWSEAERAGFAEAVAGGLLVLSDESVGGGQYLLPESVQDFAGGIPTRTGDSEGGRLFANDAHNWLRDARDLGELFSHADPNLRGGTEFSSNTTLAIGHYLDQDGARDLNAVDDAGISALLDVTTRNEEANHRILTDTATPPWENSSDRRYQSASLPDFGTTSDALVSLYTHEWGDDGAAAAGLIDWIPDGAESDDGGRQRLAREAAEGLIQMTTGDDAVYDALTNTGVTVKETVEVDGEEIEVEYPDAAFGRVNPALADAFGDVALAYLDDFRAPGNSNLPGEGNGEMYLGYTERQRFLQYAAADDDTVKELYGAASALDLDSTHRLLGEDEQADIAYRNATFRALLDAAVRTDTLDRSIDMDNAETQAAVDAKRRIAVASGLAFGAANVLPPGPGGFAIAGITAATFEFNDRVDQSVNGNNFAEAIDAGVGDDSTHAFGANDYGRTYSQLNHDYKVKLDLVDAMVRSGQISTEQVEQVSPQLLTEDGNIVDYYEFDTRERTGSRDRETGISPDTALDRLLGSEEAAITFPDGTDRGAREVAADYSKDYYAGYYEVINALSADIKKDDYVENVGSPKN
ncbi:hypothetical protein [Nocardiopsis sp. MG754419]|uniref:TPR repeat region-containing protein n=1 Tax=Nocardiopsis sp. MG754419 TaxID=2259865 RepID=UPI001BA4A425|nr:hypothetical protein [Nocardiopsis sp. MG754419]MBR8743431.1 hypothetical protein [Nocardiopsis sp. MG754419]